MISFFVLDGVLDCILVVVALVVVVVVVAVVAMSRVFGGISFLELEKCYGSASGDTDNIVVD